MSTIQQLIPTYANSSPFEKHMIEVLVKIPEGQEFSMGEFSTMTGDYSQANSHNGNLYIVSTVKENCYQGKSRPDGCKLIEIPGDKYVWQK